MDCDTNSIEKELHYYKELSEELYKEIYSLKERYFKPQKSFSTFIAELAEILKNRKTSNELYSKNISVLEQVGQDVLYNNSDTNWGNAAVIAVTQVISPFIKMLPYETAWSYCNNGNFLHSEMEDYHEGQDPDRETMDNWIIQGVLENIRPLAEKYVSDLEEKN